MSEDRLEDALREMRQEDVDAETLESARARVWNTVTNAGGATCSEFRLDFRAYLSGELPASRRALVEDHLSRCPACRTALAEAKGSARVIAMPQRTAAPRWIRWGAMAAAAAMVLGVLYLGRNAIDTMMAPGGPRATVVTASGQLYRLPSGTLATGGIIGENESVRTGPGAHAVLRLADGSMVDVNERTELFVTAAWSGQAIHLQRGDVIVKAAKQRRGHLRVLTRDSIASVKGTVFAVSAGMGGSVVSVVEGAVEVNQPGKDVLLHPGEQAASIPALASTVAEAVAWSPSADEYLQILASFVKIERQLAEQMPRELRTTSTLLSQLPAGTFVYGAIPNLGGTIGQAMGLAGQQAAENAAFGTWWNSHTGVQLRQLVDRLQSVSSLLGNEMAFCAALTGDGKQVGIVLANVQPGKRAELTTALEGLFAGETGSTLPFAVSDTLMVVSDSPAQVAWASSHLGQGAGSPFAAAIAERYRRGVGWLIGIDAAPIVKTAAGSDAPPVEFAGMIGLKHLFFEQRTPSGAEENEMTLTFHGQRTGMASWLADTGSGGAAEYLSTDAIIAGYATTREPWQLFEEFSTVMMKENTSFPNALATANEKLGPGFFENLSGAMGTESAFSLNGFSTAGPTWVMAGLVNNPSVIDSSIEKLVAALNAALPPTEQNKRVTFSHETVAGRVWNTLKPAGLPIGVTWTYDRGYMVAASDRGSAERAIATRNGGAQLVWSQEFLSQLPSSAGMHPSAFGWVNTKGALGMVSALVNRPGISELLSGKDPLLVVFDGSPELIHAASRTRISGVIVDAMLLQGLGSAAAASPQAGAGTTAR
jgi:hypothetical protein